jgi:hypothetical protein
VQDWADALVLVKELAELDEMMWAGTRGLTLTSILSAQGVSGLVRLLRRSELALGVVIGLALGLGYHFRAQLKAAPKRLKQFTSGPEFQNAMLHVADLFEKRDTTERRVQGTLVPPNPEESLEAMVARVLLQQDHPLAARDVHTRLPAAWSERGVEEVMRVLRENEPFELMRGRGWVRGHPPPTRR